MLDAVQISDSRRFCKKKGLDKDSPCSQLHGWALGIMLRHSPAALIDARSALSVDRLMDLFES